MSPRQEHLAQRKQLAALRAYMDEGSVKGAAHRLGIGESAVRRRMDAYCRERQTNLPTAIYELGREAERAHFARPEREARVSP